MSDSNPDKPTQSDTEKERLAKIAASLPGEVVSREAAFPKKRQRPKARLPETVRSKIESEAQEEAAKDFDAEKSPVEKPKFKVTRSPFAPRIEPAAKTPSPEVDAGWDDDEAKPAAKAPEVAKKPEPEIKKIEPVLKKPEPEAKPSETEKKPEAAKAAPRPLPTKLEVTRAPYKEEVKPEAKEAPTPFPKPAEAKPTETKPVDKPAAKEGAAAAPAPMPALKPIEKPAAKTAPATPAKVEPAKSAPSKLPVPAKQGDDAEKPAAQAPTRLPMPAAKPAARTAPRPKAAPAPGRQQAEEESGSVSVLWVAVDALAAVASIAFAVLVFTNMGG